MKKLLLMVVILLTTQWTTALSFPIEKVEIKTNAVCETCSNNLFKALMTSKGVQDVKINLEKSIVEVYYNSKKINAAQIREVISNVGYDADDVKANAKARATLDECCRAPEKH